MKLFYFSCLPVFLFVLPLNLFGGSCEVDGSIRVGYALSELYLKQEANASQLETFKEIKWSNIQSPVVGGTLNVHPFSTNSSTGWLGCISLRIDADCLLNAFSSDFTAKYRENEPTTFFHPKKPGGSNIRAYDVSVALKYRYPINCFCSLSILLGYQGADLHFRQHLGDMTSNDPGAADVSLFQGEDLFYKLNWNTIWVGLEPEFTFCEGWKMLGGLSYYRGRYNGNANWKANKLMTDDFRFKYDSNISQKETLYGIRANIGLEYLLGSCFKLGTKIQGEFFKNLGNGRSETDVSQTIITPSGNVIGQSNLTSPNEYDLCWKSVSARIYINYIF